jgi:hypothetical protein
MTACKIHRATASQGDHQPIFTPERATPGSPLLDAEPDRARVALDRLNEAPWHNGPVVVVCRADVYARLRELRGDAGLQDVTVT